jgi:hypothetical protein
MKLLMVALWTMCVCYSVADKLTFTCDGLSKYNTDYFKSWAYFFYAIIEFGFGVNFLMSR